MKEMQDLQIQINELAQQLHDQHAKAGWWTNPETNESLLHKSYTPYVIATKLSLIMSEVSEALDGYRSDKMDDKLTHRPMIEAELADVFIRLMDLSGALKLDLGGAIVDKLEYNKIRTDHKVENRVKPNGKKF